ncbi:hypothetical protein P171DRAFT_486523 [Karstenula rhodostoma CBS 690.94]|uniref:Uncharacterized protein n=1 Tax=Karstenula rhodostoma CBS 690.94 TaxID=1392251 RepID=A0A9P4PI94_9PLEO|nr:hypothetical protein P171DRAFT_486523 [Karstenula rhodostoma CBS 690.94]
MVGPAAGISGYRSTVSFYCSTTTSNMGYFDDHFQEICDEMYEEQMAREAEEEEAEAEAQADSDADAEQDQEDQEQQEPDGHGDDGEGDEDDNGDDYMEAYEEDDDDC